MVGTKHVKIAERHDKLYVQHSGGYMTLEAYQKMYDQSDDQQVEHSKAAKDVLGGLMLNLFHNKMAEE